MRSDQILPSHPPNRPWRTGRAIPFGRRLLAGRRLLTIAIALAGCAGNSNPNLARLPLGDVSQCAQLRLDGIGALDAVLVIDASRSTRNSSESDIDGDGEVGRFKASAMTDPDDTWLSAQVAGVRSLLHAASGPDRRFSIVSFSGRFRFGSRDPLAPAGIDRLQPFGNRFGFVAAAELNKVIAIIDIVDNRKGVNFEAGFI